MPNQFIIFIILLAWFDSLRCSDITMDQPNRLRKSLQPVSSQNVTKFLARNKYHSYNTGDGHKIHHINDLGSVNEDTGRAARKINLLGNLFQKRQPLYLVNGTVCRFVNAIPICTTLSTSGVLPPSGGNAPRPASSPATSGNNPMGQNISFNGQFTTPSTNMNPNNMNMNPNNMNMNPNQNLVNNFAPRPAALVEDDSEDINVNAMSNGQLVSSNDQVYLVNQGQAQQHQGAINVSSANNNLHSLGPQQTQSTAVPLVQNQVRPFGYLMQRRPQFNIIRQQQHHN